MKTPADKSPEPQRQATAHEAPQQQDQSDAEFQFIDNRAETTSLRQLQEAADNSPRTQGLAQFKAMMNNSPRSGAMRSLQAMVDNSPRRLVQRHAEPGEEALVQGEFVVESPAQLAQAAGAKPNNTGLPDNLKAGVESLSGLSLDNVKVHYNSSEPAQLNAHAYAQGTDIHLAPGQEQHLPHEVWHVVQQAQGRVKPTLQMKDGVEVNDDRGLEREADLMGAAAVQREAGAIESDPDGFLSEDSNSPLLPLPQKKAFPILQAVWQELNDKFVWDEEIDGVTWYSDKFNNLWFDVTNEKSIEKGRAEDYHDLKGKKNRRSWIEWNAISVIPQMVTEDLHVEAMTEMVDEEFEWGPNTIPGSVTKNKAENPSKYRKPTSLASWIYAKGPMPNIMNCWEGVLMAAYRAGLINKKYFVKAIGVKEGIPVFIQKIWNNPDGRVLGEELASIDKVPQRIPKGMIVVFGALAAHHVALATGVQITDEESEEEQNEILELDKDSGGVSKSTVEKAIKRNKTFYGEGVRWGALPTKLE